MLRKPFSPNVRRGILHFGLLFVLLFSTLADVSHSHDGGLAELQCYTCHFSPDLGLAPARALPPAPTCQQSARARLDCQAPRRQQIAAFEARGPPLLS